jgi:hypothetical protein
MTDIAAGGARELLIPPSFSDLSLQSASSGTSWQSPSSTASRKHSLDLPFDGSPQPKRRLTRDMSSTAALFRYSAPCAQAKFDIDRTERRGGGLLKRSGAPMQSLFSAGLSDTLLPPITSYLDSESDKARQAKRTAFPDLFYPRPQSSQSASTTSVLREQQDVPRRKRYSFWRLTSPPIVESTIPELDHGEEELARRETPDPESKNTISTEQTSTSSRGDIGVERVSHAETVRDEGRARLDALHSLEGTRVGNGGAQNADGVKAGETSEENPILMCGKRLYSDWTGYWSMLNRQPLCSDPKSDRFISRWCSAQDTRRRYSVPRGLSPPHWGDEAVDLPRTRLPDHLYRCLGSWGTFQCRPRATCWFLTFPEADTIHEGEPPSMSPQ